MLYKIKKALFIAGGKCYNEMLRLLFPNKAFFDPADFPIVRELEKNCGLIRDEFLKVYNQEEIPLIDDIFDEATKALNKQKKWRFFLLKSYFKDYQFNNDKTPLTAALINNKTICSAFFSVLEANSAIPVHRGQLKGVIRIHLPLVVPADYSNCYIVVDNIKRSWEKGKCLVFDDYFEHYVVNDTDEVRVVLFLDMVRPLPFPFSLVNKLLLKFIGNSGFIKDLRKKAEAYYN